MNAIHRMPAAVPVEHGAVPGMLARAMAALRACMAQRREIAIRNALLRRELHKHRISEAGLREALLRESLRLGQ